MMSPPPVKHGEFEYGNDGLKYLHRTRATPHEIQSAVTLRNERPITPHITNLMKRKYPREWWEAQIKLYGMKGSYFSIDDMKEILSRKLTGMTVSPEIQHMEQSMAKEYQDLAKEYIELEKAEEMRRKAQQEKSDREYEGWKNLQNSLPEPPRPALRYSSPEPVTAPFVKDEINRLHSQLVRTGPGNDIGGTWRIDCPEISSGYGDSMHSHTGITWIIHPPQNSKSFVWGEISQVVVDGIVRIEWPNSDNWKRKTRRFVWRGRDNGTGEIQHSDEINRGVINFVSSHECLGTFACEFGGPYTFVGRKVSRGFPERTQSIEECQKEFRRYTPRMWDLESTDRWGGCGNHDSDKEEDDEEGDEPKEVEMEERRKPKRVSMEARGVAPGANTVEEGRRKPKRVSMEARGVAPGMKDVVEERRKPKRVSMEARGVVPKAGERRRKPRRDSMEDRIVAAL